MELYFDLNNIGGQEAGFSKGFIHHMEKWTVLWFWNGALGLRPTGKSWMTMLPLVEGRDGTGINSRYVTTLGWHAWQRPLGTFSQAGYLIHHFCGF